MPLSLRLIRIRQDSFGPFDPLMKIMATETSGKSKEGLCRGYLKAAPLEPPYLSSLGKMGATFSMGARSTAW